MDTNYKSLLEAKDTAIAGIAADASDRAAQIAKIDAEFALLVRNTTAHLKKVLAEATEKLLHDKNRDNLLKNRVAFDDATDALVAWENAMKTPEQIAAEEAFAAIDAEKKEVDKAWQAAKDKLKEVYPASPSVSTERAPRTSQATVSLTPVLKQQVIDLKKAGKRNKDIAAITGLNNGQISPILQKAGLTESRS